MSAWLFVASLVLGFLSIWIVLPPPHVSILPLAVAAPELSPWLLLAALGVGAMTVRTARIHAAARTALAISIAAAALAAYPVLRLPFVVVAFDRAMEQGLGPYETAIPAPAAAGLRPHVMSIRDLGLGIGRRDVLVRRAIEFARPEGVPLTLDVYRPLSAGPHPILVQLHGGGWQTGSPEDDTQFATYLASQGYVVVALDYRRAPEWMWPAQIQDVRTGLGWILAHAAEYEADRGRIGFVGRSAGGQLALVAAFEAGSPLVRAVVAYYTPTDLTAGWQQPPTPDPLRVRSILEPFLGGSPDAQPARYREASPLAHVSRRVPPTLLIYGGRDHVVEARFGRELQQRLMDEGISAAFLEIPWAEHAFDALPTGVSSQLSLFYTERFLAWALR